MAATATTWPATRRTAAKARIAPRRRARAATRSAAGARETGGSNEEGADTRVPDEAELLRTRRIQEELRRRGAEKGRPVEELDYIDRLLKRF